MKVLVLGLFGLVLVTGLAVALLVGLEHGVRVYSVAAVRAGLARTPDAWLHRALRVRGVAVRCEDTPADPPVPCPFGLPVLRGDAGAGGDLLLEWGQSDPVNGALRGIPLLGPLLPAPGVIRWGVPATYTVEIDALPAARPGVMARYDYAVVLLNAIPILIRQGNDQ